MGAQRENRPFWWSLAGKILILLLVVACLDFAAGFLLGKLLERQRSGSIGRLHASIEEVEPAVAIFGDSRAAHHYESAVISQKIGCEFHNTGQRGMTVLFADLIQGAMLQRHRPDCVLFELNPTTLYKTPTDYDRLSGLLPYYHRHPGMRETLHKRSPMERFKLLSRSYPYNSMAINLLSGALREKAEPVGGFVPRPGLIRPSAQAAAATEEHVGSFELDAHKILTLQRFVERAEAAGSDIVVVISPVFAGHPERVALAKLSEVLEGVEVWNYLDDARFSGKPEFFYDRKHLNTEGARLYSGIIGSRLAQRPVIAGKGQEQASQ